MKRLIVSSGIKLPNRKVHFYKGHKIMQIIDSGMIVYRVQGMSDDYYDNYYNGIFSLLRDAKKSIDEYETQAEV